jgi:hypothetical protein
LSLFYLWSSKLFWQTILCVCACWDSDLVQRLEAATSIELQVSGTHYTLAHCFKLHGPHSQFGRIITDAVATVTNKTEHFRKGDLAKESKGIEGHLAYDPKFLMIRYWEEVEIYDCESSLSYLWINMRKCI